MEDLRFEFIDDKHKVAIDNFVCEEAPGVELFLKEYAFRLHKLNSAITRLYFDDTENLVGYFTLKPTNGTSLN